MLQIHFEMEADAIFLERLMDGRIIAPEDADYEQWAMLRRAYEKKRDQSVAFASARPPPGRSLYSPICSCMAASSIW